MFVYFLFCLSLEVDDVLAGWVPRQSVLTVHFDSHSQGGCSLQFLLIIQKRLDTVQHSILGYFWTLLNLTCEIYK